MSSYWQTAKREAKKRARIYGYCWVWSNPQVDWKQPYLFCETDQEDRPHGVPCHASRYGDGPPRPQEEEPVSLDKRVEELELRVADLERKLESSNE